MSIVLKNTRRRKSERMSDWSFRMMKYTFMVIGFLFPYIGCRIRKFGIEEGMTLLRSRRASLRRLGE